MNIKTMAVGGIVAGILAAGGTTAAFAASGSGSVSPAPNPTATTAAAAAAATTPAPTTGTCLPAGHDDAWPAWVQGRPAAFDAGDLGGVYLWHDANGWHLRVTHANDDKAVFTGQLVTSGTFVDVKGVQLEKSDTFTVGPKDHVVTFRFVNYGHMDGIDFRTCCAPSISFAFQRGGASLPVSRIFVGEDRLNPRHDGFRIYRTA